MTCQGRISRAFAVYRGRTSDADVHDGSVAVAGSNHVIGCVIARAVFEDQVPGRFDMDTAAVADDVVLFDPIIAARGVDPGEIDYAVIFADQAVGADSDAVAIIILGGAILNRAATQHVKAHFSCGSLRGRGVVEVGGAPGDRGAVAGTDGS